MPRSKRNKQLTELQLESLLQKKISTAVNQYTDTYTRQRIADEDYYEGRPGIIPSLEGRSKVVSRECAEAVDSALPALMRIFASIEQPVMFTARIKEDEPYADQMNDYCDWVWNYANSGYQNYMEWFKAALMFRLGTAKIWWDTRTDVTERTLESLTEEEYQALVADPEIEVIEETIYTDPDALASYENQMKQAVVQQIVSGAGMGVLDEDGEGAIQLDPMVLDSLPKIYDCKIKRRKEKGIPRIAIVPSEEMLFPADKMRDDDRHFVAHRRRVSASELREMGFEERDIDKVTFADTDNDEEKRNRRRPETGGVDTSEHYDDPSAKTTWLIEMYDYIDFDGDGVVEFRQIMCAGEGKLKVLSNEIVDDHPFAFLTPIPIPFKFVGQSLIDQTRDIQDVKTVLVRGSLDNLYQTNNQRYVITSNINQDDVLNPRPGQPVRVKGGGSVQNEIMPLPVGDNIQAQALNMMTYFDSIRENRTGVSRAGAGMDADILKSHQSGTAVSAVMTASQSRLELIARNFAETGVKRAFRRLLDLCIKHDNEEKVIKVRGRYVTVKPSEWHVNYDLTVNVGLGTGNHDQDLQRVSTVLLPVVERVITMQGGLSGPIIKDSNLYNMLNHVARLARVRNPDMFFNDPRTEPPPQPEPPPPDPRMEQVKVNAQKLQLQAQRDAKRQELEQAKLMLKARQAQAQAQIERAELELRQLELGMENQQRAADREVSAMNIFADDANKVADRELEALRMDREDKQRREDRENGLIDGLLASLPNGRA